MKRNSDPPIGRSDVNLATRLFEARRLSIARDLRGQTKAELAKMVSKTASAISQFESGRARPDVKTVASLALALGVSPSFFALPVSSSIVEVDACHFRSLRSATQRQRRQLIARGLLVSDLLEVLEQFVELPRERVTEVMRSPKSPEDIEDIAIDVRRAWGLGNGPIPHIVKLLENKGIVVARIPSSCHEVDAFSTWHHGRPVISLVSLKNSTSRARFDATHELGHLVMHSDAIPGDQELERQANRFAGAFLVPRESFLKECPRTLDWGSLYELKRRWRVSVAGLIRRAFDLGRYSEATYRRAFVKLNQSGERLHEADEPPIEEPTMVERALAIALESTSEEEVLQRLGVSRRELQGLLP